MGQDLRALREGFSASALALPSFFSCWGWSNRGPTKGSTGCAPQVPGPWLLPPWSCEDKSQCSRLLVPQPRRHVQAMKSGSNLCYAHEALMFLCVLIWFTLHVPAQREPLETAHGETEHVSLSCSAACIFTLRPPASSFMLQLLLLLPPPPSSSPSP